MNGHLLKVLQRRMARSAVGASAARGHGAAGVVARARAFTSAFRLDRLATRDSQVYSRRLDAATVRLMRNLPRKAASWGLARRLLNIFIRDCVYVGYFRSAYRLDQIETFCEVPLDSITAKQLKKAVPDLPRWPGVRHLKRDGSDEYQRGARTIARRRRIAPLHLDAYWWGARE